MKVLTCAAARHRLQAFHDGELPVGEQISVAAHLEWCDGCVEALSDMRLLGAVLRSAASGRIGLTREEDASLHASIVSRVRAEQTVSLSARVHEALEDMHMVYAGLGAVAATLVFMTIMWGMMRFAIGERSPGSNQNPVVVDARMLLPRALDQTFLTATSGQSDEGAVTLSAVVTREGRIVNLELHSGAGQTPPRDGSEAEALQSLLGAMARARFEPARVAGLPVAVNMVWMVAHTTVRAAKEPIGGPARHSVKKRRVDVSVRPVDWRLLAA